MCLSVGRTLSKKAIPADTEDVPPVGVRPEDAGNFYLVTVAVCHQTQLLTGEVEGGIFRGWDFLSRSLARAFGADPLLLTPECLARTSPGQFVSWLGGDGAFGELSGVEGRAELVRDLGAVMQRHGWRTLRAMYDVAGGRCVTGSPSLVELLSAFRAYQDPVRKKSVFLLGLMANGSAWRYPDYDRIPSPVDYHEVRGHLRLGTVVLTDPALQKKILERRLVTAEEDVAIRTAVGDAIGRIAEIVRATPMQMHYLFWNLFRNVCRRDQPFCLSCPTDVGVPPRYAHLIRQQQEAVPACPFAGVCPSAGRAGAVEHAFVTDWY